MKKYNTMAYLGEVYEFFGFGLMILAHESEIDGEIVESEIDGEIVVQIGSSPHKLINDDGSPRLRINLNDETIYDGTFEGSSS